MPVDKNRRRNQIITERAQDKIRLEKSWSDASDAYLWTLVSDALADNAHLRRVLGHVDRGCTAVLAELALEELQRRGVQLQLPV